MTRDELNRRRMMFQIYANRNKMPQLQKNDNEEPLKHSATNEYLEYRKKVAAGMKMQRDNRPSDLFNVTEANEQYYQDLMDQNIIIHAGMNNQYIAKLDDFYGKGKPRYFYDQTEWDNYRKNMQGAGQAGANRGAREGADARNKALANKAQEAFTNANRNSALNTAQSRREEAISKSQKDLYNKALASEALKGKNGAVVNRMTSLGKAQGGREAAIKNSGSFVKSSDDEKSKTPEIVQEAQSGRENAIKRSDPKYQKELEKAKSIKSDKDRWAAYSQKDIESVTSNDKRFNTIKTEDDAVNYPGGVEKLYNDIEAALEEKYPNNKKNYEAANKSGADRAAKEKENAENKKSAKHSSLEDGITTSEDISPEQEYLDFRARVEEGMKHYSMARGLMSVPVNQALKNGESLSHAGTGNFKYYQKIDLGNGKSRYFYTKDEWDAYNKGGGAGYQNFLNKQKSDKDNYQKNADAAKNAGADRAVKQKEEASKPVTKPNIDRSNLLNKAQSGREAAINNSSPLANNSSSSSSSNNPVKKFASNLIDAINNKGTSDKVVTTVIVEDNTPEIVQKAQSGREAAEKESTKRTMTTMAYNKAVKDYQEVAKEIDKEYGFDKLDPSDAKAVNKTWQKLIKDTAKVIKSGKVDNPNNVKYEYQLKDDDANSYAWAAYIQDYASENLRLNSIYNDLHNEYAKTLRTAQAMHDFDAIAEANRHASELYDQMENVRDQMEELKKESDAKVLPYLAAVYKELL